MWQLYVLFRAQVLVKYISQCIVTHCAGQRLSIKHLFFVEKNLKVFISYCFFLKTDIVYISKFTVMIKLILYYKNRYSICLCLQKVSNPFRLEYNSDQKNVKILSDFYFHTFPLFQTNYYREAQMWLQSVFGIKVYVYYSFLSTGYLFNVVFINGVYQ